MKTTATLSLASSTDLLGASFLFQPKTHTHQSIHQDYTVIYWHLHRQWKKEALSFSLTSQPNIDQSCKLLPCQQKAKESIVVVSLLSFLWIFYCLFNSQVLIIWCSKVQTSSIYFDKVSKKLFVCFQRWKYFKVFKWVGILDFNWWSFRFESEWSSSILRISGISWMG